MSHMGLAGLSPSERPWLGVEFRGGWVQSWLWGGQDTGVPVTRVGNGVLEKEEKGKRSPKRGEVLEGVRRGILEERQVLGD